MMKQASEIAMRSNPPRTWQWRSLLKSVAVASVAISIFAGFAFDPEIPIATGVLVAIGLLWMLRPGRGGAIYTGVVHLLIGLVVLVLFQNAQELAYPASWMVFVSTGARLIATVAAVVAAGGALLRDPDPRGSRSVGAVALLALALIVAVGIGSRLLVSSDVRHPGDLALRITRETKWSTQELQVQAGTTSIHVENEDVHQGNFTIDGVVSLDIPAGTAKRRTFRVLPGKYRYYSKLFPGEPEMRGTLIAS